MPTEPLPSRSPDLLSQKTLAELQTLQAQKLMAEQGTKFYRNANRVVRMVLMFITLWTAMLLIGGFMVGKTVVSTLGGLDERLSEGVHNGVADGVSKGIPQADNPKEQRRLERALREAQQRLQQGG